MKTWKILRNVWAETLSEFYWAFKLYWNFQKLFWKVHKILGEKPTLLWNKPLVFKAIEYVGFCFFAVDCNVVWWFLGYNNIGNIINEKCICELAENIEFFQSFYIFFD